MACKHGNAAMHCGWCEDQAELTAARGEIERLRGLLREALEMADNWPGIAYTDDLVMRCKEAMPGWAPTFE